MKKTVILCCLSSMLLSFCGCVTRSYTDIPARHGSRLGSAGEGKVKSTKRVWIWEDEFSNP